MTASGRPFEIKVQEEIFKAEITITRTARQCQANERGYFDAAAEVVKTELLSVTLSANEVENLKAKIHAHVGLVGLE